MPVGNKPLRRQPRTTQITPRKPRTRNVKLPNNPSRHRLQPAVQNINSKIRDAAADKTASIRGECALEGEVTDMHRRFGDAIHIDQERSVVSVAQVPLVELPELQRFAAKNHIAKCERPAEVGMLQVRLHQLIKRGWSSIEDGDAFARNEAQRTPVASG